MWCRCLEMVSSSPPSCAPPPRLPRVELVLHSALPILSRTPIAAPMQKGLVLAVLPACPLGKRKLRHQEDVWSCQPLPERRAGIHTPSCETLGPESCF